MTHDESLPQGLNDTPSDDALPGENTSKKEKEKGAAKAGNIKPGKITKTPEMAEQGNTAPKAKAAVKKTAAGQAEKLVTKQVKIKKITVAGKTATNTPVQKEMKATGAQIEKIKISKPSKTPKANKTAVQEGKISDNAVPASDDLKLQQDAKDILDIKSNDANAQAAGTINSPVKTSLLPESNKDVQKPSPLRKITFQLKFHTQPGQSLFVSADHPLLGNDDWQKAFPLNYLNPDYWSQTLEVPETELLAEDISYNYLLKNEDGSFIMDWGRDKIIKSVLYNSEEVLLIDSWNSSSFIENTFYTEPFQQILLRGSLRQVQSEEPKIVTHIFKIKAPLLTADQAICIIGSVPELGSWSSETPLLLSGKSGDAWQTISLDLSTANFPVSYKYGLYHLKTKSLLHLEQGNNRTLFDGFSPNKLTVVSDGFALLPFKPFKGAGVAIPVFSLRSEKSFGVGEFADLKLMIDWARQTGLKLVQLLPVNDTTATHTFADSYPYAAISAFALHPLYLHLPALEKDNPSLPAEMVKKQAELNVLAEVDYVEVMRAKWDYVKEIFPRKKVETFGDPNFIVFFNENAHWLVPYAAFSFLREQNKTSEFSKWSSHNIYDSKQVDELASSPSGVSDEIGVYYYIQYHLHLQLKEATNYAHENGIIVKGDIPIGIYRNSCDAWQQPELFYMDMQAGAPPDDFAIKGQNWGFPTYNWQRMLNDGFNWWKKRFHQMSYYFDAFRIDHILGFFRIWSIPVNAVQGIMGHFVPAIPVHINEFYERGINYSYERFCSPYITDEILRSIFGQETPSVINEFLNALPGGTYAIKETFDTQRKTEEHFAKKDQTTANDAIREGLYDLLSNVILFEEKGSHGQQFHFRIAMFNTPSYQQLDGHTQYLLRDLYDNYFFRRQDDFWMKEAMLKLPELKRSTNMLICGEDLGMVPDCVPGVMHDLAILSLEIQRMPKNPLREFFHPNDAPYLSVVTPSTHDMSTIRGWWEEDRAATQRFFNNELGQWGTATYFCEPWVNKIILMQHLYSPAMWSIFQLQDWLGISAALRRQNPHEERINIPADPRHYWRYRMHLTLETLINETGFSNEVKGYVMQSGR